MLTRLTATETEAEAESAAQADQESQPTQSGAFHLDHTWTEPGSLGIKMMGHEGGGVIVSEVVPCTDPLAASWP
jgi:hypothetical protein